MDQIDSGKRWTTVRKAANKEDKYPMITRNVSLTLFCLSKEIFLECFLAAENVWVHTSIISVPGKD